METSHFKKALSLFLAVIMLFSGNACGSVCHAGRLARDEGI